MPITVCRSTGTGVDAVAAPGPRPRKSGLRTARGLRTRVAIALVLVAVALTGQTVRGEVATLPPHPEATFDAVLFSLINQDRAVAGLAPVRWNASLRAVAESRPYTGCGSTVSGRAQDMIRRNYFSHIICGSQNVFDVMQSAGVPYDRAGENIGWESGYIDPQQAARYLNAQYMNSPEHRANILNPRFTDVGVGVATTAAGEQWTGDGPPMTNVYMSVEDFASLPDPGAAPAP